jgi:hypothetical protein
MSADAGADASMPVDAAGDTSTSHDAGTDSPPDASPDAPPDVADANSPPPAPTKIDLVFVVENQREAAAEEQVLSLVVPDLLSRLLNPACVDGSGVPVPPSMQPSPTDTCPSGTQRDFPVILDAHIGLLSSSLGSFGADGCPDTTTTTCSNGASSTANDDHGHLVSRADPCAPGAVATYQSLGFLAWDPKSMLTPPGTTQIGDGTTPGLAQSLQNLLLGDGQNGCGFASQEEAWYRFLVDPAPYQTIGLTNNRVATMGTDSTLLGQRASFLRPDSLLLVFDVTHEPEESIKEYSSYPLFAQLNAGATPFHLPRARQECTTNGPLDPCCASCGQAAPNGCPVDPTCQSSPTYTDAEENLALRAFGLTSHKARYGIEFFYQPSRYVTALTSPTVTDATGQMVPNPLFASGRPPQDVFYATMTGVPWQLVARQKSGVPDLVNGVSDLDPKAVGGFKTYAELLERDPKGNVFWDDIAGDPENYVAPGSPYMQESTAPRSGTDPITGVAISPAGSPNGTNPINGHEFPIATPPGDIEYACVYPLLHPIDCSQPGAVCDCAGSGAAGNPLCDPNPNDSGNPTLQTRGKAYPGLKELAIAKGMGTQGIVTSICPAQLSDNTQGDYGYDAAAKTIVDAVKGRLRGQ